MAKTWFISDTHFGHRKLLEFYKNREQLAGGTNEEAIERFDSAMVERWNSLIGRGDTVYHIGDFGGGTTESSIKVLRRLNGKKQLVPGNHDRKLVQNAEFLRQWTVVHPYSYKEVSVEGQKIVLSHFPMWEWNQIHRGAWHIHGHLHGKPHHIPGKILDVGVDGHHLYPYELDEVAWLMNQADERNHH